MATSRRCSSSRPGRPISSWPRTRVRSPTGSAPKIAIMARPEFTVTSVPAPGRMHVDWEERVDFRRLHTYRLGRAQQAIVNAGLGAVLVFDMNNIRYLTSTTIGEWARDKVARFALQNCGIKVVDAQQAMLDARMIKSQDEIILLSMSAALVDGVYQTIYEALKPGIRENEIVAIANKQLYDMGSDDVEAINAVSGERCSPHPHVFSDRLIRPGDQAFFDIIHSYNGYRTCYYRTFNVGRATQSQRDAYKQARDWIDAGIDMVKPGVSTDMIAKAWPKAQDFGFDSEMEAFGLQFGHGLGLALHERPIISRLNSLQHPVELKEGMVFALETYCPADDGHSAARIEEEVVVTATGHEVITLFPAEELVIANAY